VRKSSALSGTSFIKEVYETIMQSTFSSHGFELSDSELAQFEQFLSLFIEYNSHTNLSSIRDREGIILKHFVDSLYGVSIVSEIIEHTTTPVRLLDIGSG
jgi:16S rRNA (guanine527-N7)-methyltransferase